MDYKQKSGKNKIKMTMRDVCVFRARVEESNAVNFVLSLSSKSECKQSLCVQQAQGASTDSKDLPTTLVGCVLTTLQLALDRS